MSLNLNSPRHLHEKVKRRALHLVFVSSLPDKTRTSTSSSTSPPLARMSRRGERLPWVCISMSCWKDRTPAARHVKPVGVWRESGCALLQHTLLCLNWLHISLLAAGADCTTMQPLLVPITSTQIEEERAAAVRTTQAHPCRNDCLGMNTKDEVQLTRSKNRSLSPRFALKLQQEVASGDGRGGKSQEETTEGH